MGSAVNSGLTFPDFSFIVLKQTMRQEKYNS